jgi:hypothetical protein
VPALIMGGAGPRRARRHPRLRHAARAEVRGAACSRASALTASGPHGLLQPIADGVKLLLKEDLMPASADRPIFNLAPVVFLVPCLLIFATDPVRARDRRRDLNTGVPVLPRRVVDGDRRPVHGRVGLEQQVRAARR